MKQSLKNFGGKVLHNDSIVFTFLRSIAASQASSWVDLGLSFALFAWIGLQPWLSTALGALAGGVVNCILNYRFTYHAQGISWKAIIIKYAMVWFGSMTLNSLGTEGVYWLLNQWKWLEEIGFRPDGYFAAARLFTALMVSWAWNFMLQNYFVYRKSKFDPTAIKIFNAITFRKGKEKDSTATNDCE